MWFPHKKNFLIFFIPDFSPFLNLLYSITHLFHLSSFFCNFLNFFLIFIFFTLTNFSTAPSGISIFHRVYCICISTFPGKYHSADWRSTILSLSYFPRIPDIFFLFLFLFHMDAVASVLVYTEVSAGPTTSYRPDKLYGHL